MRRFVGPFADKLDAIDLAGRRSTERAVRIGEGARRGFRLREPCRVAAPIERCRPAAQRAVELERVVRKIRGFVNSSVDKCGTRL